VSRIAVVVSALALFPLVLIAMPDWVRIPPLAKRGPGDPPDAALFSHWSHNDHHCYACHPSLFPQAKRGFTHADMDKGRYCGACHDGKHAFSVDDAECEDCHRPARAR
jgi:c(7)-type cytochrome triheme protein